MKGEWEIPIILRVRRGDREAFAVIVEHYSRPIYNLMYRMTGNFEDARDLAQETFTRAFAHLARFDERSRFFPWLYTVALNLARNHQKKSAKDLFVPVEADRFISKGHDPERELDARLDEQRLQELLGRLGAHEKEAVILRYYQGFSFEEVAQILGISCSGAKMRVYRALKRIRSWLKEETLETLN